MSSKVFKVLILIAILVGIAWGHRPCILRSYPFGKVCVCNATYCDTLDDDLLRLDTNNRDQIMVITTSTRGLRFSRTNGSWADDEMISVEDYSDEPLDIPWTKQFFSTLGNIPHWLSNKANVFVDPSSKFQKMMGFGGALTGTVSHLLQSIPESLQDSVLESYYSDKTGIGYNMVRITIGGSDFDLSPWAYNDFPEDDRALTNFTHLDPRDEKIVEFLNKMKSLVDVDLKINAAAWGCPRWMRETRRRGGPGGMKPEYYQTWADYHLRYLRLMKERGIEMFTVSTGNEPMNGLIGWIIIAYMTIGWKSYQAAEFLGDHLGPTLKNSEFKDVHILAGDDQRSLFPWYFQEMVSHRPDCLNYLSGFAVHCYLDPYLIPETLDLSQEIFPDKFILNTEASLGDVRYHPRGPNLGSWDRAAEYIDMYTQSLTHSVVGWIDWNLVLDETGGPNYVNNTVDAPVVVNATGAEVYKQPMFYTIGHFSKFVKDDSVHIFATSDWGDMSTIAFLRPDNSVVMMLHNKFLDYAEVTITDTKRGMKKMRLPPLSLSTVVYQAE